MFLHMSVRVPLCICAHVHSIFTTRKTVELKFSTFLAVDKGGALRKFLAVGNLAVWRFSGLAVCRFGGLAVWRFGGLAVGGLVVWRLVVCGLRLAVGG